MLGLARISSRISQFSKSFQERLFQGQSPQVTRKQMMDTINLGYLESETSEIFSPFLEGDTLQGITHGDLVVV